MRVDEFDFDLPEASIALEPASPRDSARLLHVAQDRAAQCDLAGPLVQGIEAGYQFHDRAIRELPGLLAPGDLLVVNNTKVIPAQLTGIRLARDAQTSQPIKLDITLHKDESRNQNNHDLADEKQENAQTLWRAFVRPAKRVRPGDNIAMGDALTATVLERDGPEVLLAFSCRPDEFMATLMTVGAPPLPPYIARKRALNRQDWDSYQTCYARHEGSVAAPTAGLHFTPELLRALKENSIGMETITLHVGAGTFLPVSADDTKDHKMHSEWGEITHDQAQRINSTRASGGKVIAVGTTSLRLLESAADENGTIHPFCGDTDIFITPGYSFRAADRLITNFHLPRSTLFMLVCAFAGTEAMKHAYRHAIDDGYRFYSFGDACLLDRADCA